MVIAWLMARKGLPLNEAFTFLKSRRPLVSPNEGFMQQLAMFGIFFVCSLFVLFVSSVLFVAFGLVFFFFFFFFFFFGFVCSVVCLFRCFLYDSCFRFGETLNRRPSLAQSTPSFSAHVSLGGGNAARVKSLKVQRRNSTVVLGSSRASSPPPMRRSYSRPDVLISEPNLKIGEMDAQDKSDWASLEACYGGVSVMSKFENHVPALISPHPKSAPAKFGGNDNNDDANMHKSKKEIDGDWPAGNASAEPPQPPSSAKAAGPIPKTLSPRKHKEPELRSSHGQNWNEVCRKEKKNSHNLQLMGLFIKRLKMTGRCCNGIIDSRASMTILNLITPQSVNRASSTFMDQIFTHGWKRKSRAHYNRPRFRFT